MFYEQLADRLELPNEVWDIMMSLREKAGELPELQDDLFDRDYPVKQLEGSIEALADDIGMHSYTLGFYLLFIAAERLWNI